VSTSIPEPAAGGSEGVAYSVAALDGIPEIRPGDDLAAIVGAAYTAFGPRDGDILVVTSKVVSKAEGRIVLADSREAAIDAETVRVVATVEHAGGRTRIVENPQGLVLAAAGVDASNAEDGEVLLLPEEPDASARALASALREATGARLGVILSDTLGRAWRTGQIDQAIGAAGVRVVDDLRGSTDSRGRPLEATIAALGDELASAAELVKGKASGRPVAVVRGLGHLVTEGLDGPGARALQRPAREDLFRVGAAEAWREGYQAALAAAPAVREWTVVVPVMGSGGKSRLAASDELAAAIAIDTVRAALGCDRVARVLVVAPDDALVSWFQRQPPDPGPAGGAIEHVADPGGGLRAAIAAGIRLAEGGPRAVLLGDLPALHPDELSHALALAATAGRAFVPDADGTGTVLATGRAGLPFEPLFGVDSAAAHRAAGFAELHLPDDWGLRRDVDAPEHLDSLRGRLGPRTAALLP